MQFTNKHYQRIHELVFSDTWPGYRPQVIESPDGDGNFDEGKRYAHVAYKYLDACEDKAMANELRMYYSMAFKISVAIARALELPPKLYPKIENSAMRVLEYSPGVGSYAHTDFDLFTLMMYRDQPDKFVIHNNEPTEQLQKINKQVHTGELLEIEEIAKACKHSVLPSETHQHSIVFFAIPDYDTVLSTGQTVGEWLEERMSRSRKETE